MGSHGQTLLNRIYYAFFAGAIAAIGGIAYKTTLTEKDLGRRAMDVCVLNNTAAPMKPQTLDSALALAHSLYAAHGIDIVMTEKSEYRGRDAQDVLDYFNGSPKATQPEPFCTQPHTAIAIFTNFPATDAGVAHLYKPVLGVFSNTRAHNGPAQTTVHEIGHLLGLRHSADVRSYMYFKMHSERPEWTQGMTSQLRANREGLYRGIDSTLSKTTRSK